MSPDMPDQDNPVASTLVLAAGLARRFGGGKLLAEFDGRPLIQHVLDLAAAAGLNPVVVVLGADAAAIEARVKWHNELRLVNPAPERGISGSIRLGIAALARLPGPDRAVVLLADQPRLTLAQLTSILAAPRDPARPIVVPRFGAAPGNPVLLERSAWRYSRALRGDVGFSQLFGSHPGLVRYLDVVGANPGIDTPGDLLDLEGQG